MFSRSATSRHKGSINSYRTSHQTGDSSAGLVMFLAGLVVGAILSTIYFGYTSNNQSIGGGIKELTRQSNQPASDVIADAAASKVDTVAVPGTAAASTDYSFYDNLPNAQEPVVNGVVDVNGVIDVIDKATTDNDVISGEAGQIRTIPGVLEDGDGVANSSTQTAGDGATSNIQPVTPAMGAQPTVSTTPTINGNIAMATIVTDEQASGMTNVESMAGRDAATVTGSGRLPPSSSTSTIGTLAATQPIDPALASQATTTAADVPPVIKKVVKANPGPRTSGMTNKGEFFMLQLAAYDSYERADKLRASLAIKGVESLIQKVDGRPGRYRVRMGPFIDYSKLARAEDRVRNLGIRPERMLERHRG